MDERERLLSNLIGYYGDASIISFEKENNSITCRIIVLRNGFTVLNWACEGESEEKAKANAVTKIFEVLYTYTMDDCYERMIQAYGNLTEHKPN
jgi:hypothetical protein